MIPSYKTKSKLTNIISLLAGFIVYIGKDELAKVLPAELVYLAPFIVYLASYIAIQRTEDTRVDRAVERAETRIANQYAQEDEDAPTMN